MESIKNKGLEDVKKAIEEKSARSAWENGVKQYALGFIEDIELAIKYDDFFLDEWGNRKLLNRVLLNGAKDWSQYSWGGGALIYNSDIAERLCNASELKKTDHGRLKPNSREEWLDVQSRALSQAAYLVYETGLSVFEMKGD